MATFPCIYVFSWKETQFSLKRKTSQGKKWNLAIFFHPSFEWIFYSSQYNLLGHTHTHTLCSYMYIYYICMYVCISVHSFTSYKSLIVSFNYNTACEIKLNYITLSRFYCAPDCKTFSMWFLLSVQDIQLMHLRLGGSKCFSEKLKIVHSLIDCWCQNILHFIKIRKTGIKSLSQIHEWSFQN